MTGATSIHCDASGSPGASCNATSPSPRPSSGERTVYIPEGVGRGQELVCPCPLQPGLSACLPLMSLTVQIKPRSSGAIR